MSGDRDSDENGTAPDPGGTAVPLYVFALLVAVVFIAAFVTGRDESGPDHASRTGEADAGGSGGGGADDAGGPGDAETLIPPMVSIPGGTYVMGDNDYHKSTRPEHRVTVPDFALGRDPVTRAAFEVFIDASGYRTTAEDGTGCKAWHPARSGSSVFDWAISRAATWRDPAFAQEPDEPVVCLTVEDIEAYIEWLNAETGRDFRLPSEAEWEYAARAGSDTHFFAGVEREQVCQYANLNDQAFVEAGEWAGWNWPPMVPCDDGAVYTSAVGRYRANDFGLNDTLGNVAEVTADCWHRDYVGATGDGSPREKADCENRPVRGGSWKARYHSPSLFMRERLGWEPASDIGFRLAESQ